MAVAKSIDHHTRESSDYHTRTQYRRMTGTTARNEREGARARGERERAQYSSSNERLGANEQEQQRHVESAELSGSLIVQLSNNSAPLFLDLDLDLDLIRLLACLLRIRFVFGLDWGLDWGLDCVIHHADDILVGIGRGDSART